MVSFSQRMKAASAQCLNSKSSKASTLVVSCVLCGLFLFVFMFLFCVVFASSSLFFGSCSLMT